MKPSYKTGEFWLTISAQVIGWLMASGIFAEGSLILKGLGLAAAALSSVGYSAYRNSLKKKEFDANVSAFHVSSGKTLPTSPE